MMIVLMPISLVLLTAISCITAENWFLMWMLMELSMTGMVYLLYKDKKKEMAMLFFVFQLMPSMAVLVSIIVEDTLKMNNPTITMLVLTAMVMKIGMFPLQMWVIKMSTKVSWTNNCIMMTVQKVIPMSILAKLMIKSFTIIVVLVSMVAMTIFILKMSVMKPFLMVSSLVHTSWMIMSMIYLKLMYLIYLSVYSIILITLVKEIKNMKTKFTLNKYSMSMPFSSIKVMMLSMSGVPPMLGFTVKVLVIYGMIKSCTSNVMVLLALLTSTVLFYGYMQVIFKNLMLEKMSGLEKRDAQEKLNKTSILMNICPLSAMAFM